MARNEEQFYGMFKEAFRDFTPEAPAHVFEGVQASLGKERSLSGSRWLWAGALVLLLGSGASWLYFHSGKNEIAATPGAISANVNGAIYKAHWSIGLEESGDEITDNEIEHIQIALSAEPAARSRSSRSSAFSGTTNGNRQSSTAQEATLGLSGSSLTEENVVPLSAPTPEFISGTPVQDPSNSDAIGDPLDHTPETSLPETRKFVIQGKKTITIEEE